MPRISWENKETLYESYRAQMAFMETAQREPIGLPHDGETFNDESLSDLYWRVVGLIEMGYQVPHGVVQVIEEEMGEYSDERE